jgi:hypothetical protein
MARRKEFALALKEWRHEERVYKEEQRARRGL